MNVPQNHVQIGIVGTGFAGSITGLMLHSLGYDVALFDRATHPRFAIGESSTPIADRILERLAHRYGLGELLPLSAYGRAIQTTNEFVVGPKRGFSYFRQRQGMSFDTTSPSENELLVAANSSLDTSDTHWHRATVDHYLVRQLKAKGVPVYLNSPLDRIERNQAQAWELTFQSEQPGLTCDFLVDASGRHSPLAACLGLRNSTHRLLTRSGGIFAHFANVSPTADYYPSSGGPPIEHPFPCDQAAVHQVCDDGWMWQLRFDNRVTSAGWCLAPEVIAEIQTPEPWWQSRLARFPSIAQQFAGAELTAPASGLQVVRRLQFLRETSAGNGWVMLPSTAGFIDPLHSSGIAHSLSAIERLGATFEVLRGRLPSEDSLQAYNQQLQHEFQWIDRLVSGCYLGLPSFERFTLYAMWYFLATIHYETRRADNQDELPGFLSADQPELRRRAEIAWQQMATLESTFPAKMADHSLAQHYRDLMSEFNHVGLLSPNVHPYYSHTSAPGK